MSNWIAFFLLVSTLFGVLLSVALGVWAYAVRRPRSLPEPPPWLLDPEPPPRSGPPLFDDTYARLDRAATRPLTLTPDDEAYLAFRAAEYRQELEAMIERHQAAKAEIAAQFDDWLVALGKQYKLWQYDELKGFERWVALILRHSQLYHAGDFPVRTVWKEVQAIYGADAPRKRYTSYTFFRRLNEALIEAGIVTRGQPGIAGRLNAGRLPGWVFPPAGPDDV